MRTSALTLGFILLAACSKAPSTPPAEGSGDPVGPVDQVDQPEDETVERPQLTAEACEAEGGTVVGDIGDGAIHRPDYRCSESGEAPIGSIVAEAGGPIAIEGAVCCK
jgi:hypothetical protein